ncbi:hypothetical protein LBMAG27_02840 [Bacteroidota bacterium]|nr:hypothetical protein LBMAG27_02840 [Bacteroidota bacterium]
MKDTNKMIAAMLVGAAVGGAVAWFLTSEKKEEMLTDLKDTAEKVKKEFNDVIDKGRQVVEDLTGKKETSSNNKS